ncbi:Protein mesA [Zancudomyces culisetae]|uniref:Protein mesA n=1 Tax=Zancudomyces culisetae TaxID=1213189 RepID=A0A1R1PI53_ZANCU|nr:Protein mesA [Zancudomyces culisetae]|eukprot:OMH80664.1 Protein mesA [Zancudomyces culisetae]
MYEAVIGRRGTIDRSIAGTNGCRRTGRDRGETGEFISDVSDNDNSGSSAISNNKDSDQYSGGDNSDEFTEDSSDSAGEEEEEEEEDLRYYETRIKYQGVNLPVRIEQTMYPEEIGECSVIKLLSNFGGMAQASNGNNSSYSSSTIGTLSGSGVGSFTLTPAVAGSNMFTSNSSSNTFVGGGASINSGVSNSNNSNSNNSSNNVVGIKTNHEHLDVNAKFGSNYLTNPIMVLMNALLTEKRIVFLGHNMPAGEVGEYVLAAVVMASGGGGRFLRGSFKHRTFPYTNLSNIDKLLKVPGYIAGVTNPTFEVKEKWWDILCNINTGKIKISSYLTSNSKGKKDDNFKKLKPKRFLIAGADYFGNSHYSGYDHTSASPSQNHTPLKSIDKLVYLQGISASTPLSQPHPPPKDSTNLFSLTSASLFSSSSTQTYGYDSDFINDLYLSIERHCGEMAIRRKFEQYVSSFILLAGLYQYETHLNLTQSEAILPSLYRQNNGLKEYIDNYILRYDISFIRSRELPLNKGRLEGFLNSSLYLYLISANASANQNGPNNDIACQLSDLDLLFLSNRLHFLSNSNLPLISGSHSHTSGSNIDRDMNGNTTNNSHANVNSNGNGNGNGNGSNINKKASKGNSAVNAENIGAKEFEIIINLLHKHIVLPEHVTALISYFPLTSSPNSNSPNNHTSTATTATGGLTPLIHGLYHPNFFVKYKTTALFKRFQDHPIATRFIDHLEFYHRLTLANLIERLFS